MRVYWTTAEGILLRYFKTLSVGPVWISNPLPPAQQTGDLPTELARRQLNENFKLFKTEISCQGFAVGLVRCQRWKTVAFGRLKKLTFLRLFPFFALRILTAHNL